MKICLIKRGLENISSIYSSLLLETNTVIEKDKVSWPGYKPGIFKNIVYAAEFQRLIDDRQFSLLLTDNSFFQFYYLWEGDEITAAKLCYYPSPVVISGAIDELRKTAEESGIDLIEELYFGAEGWAELGIDVVNTSHIRLDYDSTVTSHSPCHLQFAAFNCFRISSEVLLNPFVFFEWIIRNVYPIKQSEISSKVSYSAIAKLHYKTCSTVPIHDNNLPKLTINN